MLIEFSVENHRAFREKQTFSMVASATTERAHVAETGFSAAPFALREACLFGANGSGKSSLIDAMAFVSRFVRTSFRNEAGQGTGVQPFLFHSDWRKKPSEFEVLFINGNILYQYGFALTKERVVEEWLFARPKSTGRQRVLFTRTYDAESDSYDWDINPVHLKGERDSWRSQTRPDALFLSTAVQLNAEGLKSAHEWLAKHLRMFSMSGEARQGYTHTRFEEAGWKERIIAFLKQADVSLQDIEVDESSLVDHVSFSQLPAAIQAAIREDSPEAKTYDVRFVRKDDQGVRTPLPLEEESSGTRALFELAGPVLDVLDNGWTVVVDELNSGLHPLAFQHLIAMFCNPKLNPHDAQLIFTTHDTSVTEQGSVGRDQIWLVEKGLDLAARLTPFSDYKTRDARPFQKGYLQGRYGAVPRLGG